MLHCTYVPTFKLQSVQSVRGTGAGKDVLHYSKTIENRKRNILGTWCWKQSSSCIHRRKRNYWLSGQGALFLIFRSAVISSIIQILCVMSAAWRCVSETFACMEQSVTHWFVKLTTSEYRVEQDLIIMTYSKLACIIVSRIEPDVTPNQVHGPCPSEEISRRSKPFQFQHHEMPAFLGTS